VVAARLCQVLAVGMWALTQIRTSVQFAPLQKQIPVKILQFAPLRPILSHIIIHFIQLVYPQNLSIWDCFWDNMTIVYEKKNRFIVKITVSFFC